MSRPIALLLAVLLALGASAPFAQTKKAAAPGKIPKPTDNSIAVSVYMRDASKNELLVSTRIWPDYPEYNTVALQRFFALMKALDPPYRQDDQVAYSWATKAKVTKCTIYLESAEANAKTGTGAVVGCEANGVSSLAVTSGADPAGGVSASQDPKHLGDVLAMFKKQSERAKGALPK